MDPFQPLNDASPFDFKLPRPGGNLKNDRPFIVHYADDEEGNEYPQVLMGQLGDVHQDIRDRYDTGPEILRGYYDETGKPQVEVGDESYLPMVDQHLENVLEQEESDWDEDYPGSEHTAGIQDGHWAYLNGEVGFGQFPHQILDSLGERQQLPQTQKSLITNLALANAHPANTGHDVAWGTFHQGYPVFWRTNVDRNAIWDAVANARRVVEPPQRAVAGLKELSEVDYLKTATIASGGRLVEIHPGDEYLAYDGEPAKVPDPMSHPQDSGSHDQNFYGANVTGDEGKILGSVMVEVDSKTTRDGDHGQHVILRDSYVSPDSQGTDVWLKLYEWVRTHWPNERLFGDIPPSDQFEHDNKHHYLGDDGGWDETGIGSEGGDPGLSEDHYTPQWYSKHSEVEVVKAVPGQGYHVNGRDVTDQVRTWGSVGVDPDTSRPSMYMSTEKGEPPGRSHGILTRVNMFRQGPWRWGEKDLGTDRVVSVEHGPHHHYTMRVNFNGPVHLRKYDGLPSLRPTSYGDLEMGNQVSTLRLRGREHPVYESIDVNPRRATERVGVGRFIQRAPWLIDSEGNPIVGNWGDYHKEYGSALTWAQHRGDVDETGRVTVNVPTDPEAPHDPQSVFDQISPHLRRRFGYGFHPFLHTEQTPTEWDFSKLEKPGVPYKAPVSDSQPLGDRLKAMASRLIGRP